MLVNCRKHSTDTDIYMEFQLTWEISEDIRLSYVLTTSLAQSSLHLSIDMLIYCLASPAGVGIELG